MTAQQAAKWKLIVGFATVYLIWGSTYLAIRYAIETMPPLLMTGVRFITAGLLFITIARLRGVPLPTARQWRWAALIGTMMLAVATGGVAWAEQWVPSGLAALLVAMVPMWIVIADWINPHGKRPTWQVVVGLIIGFVGVYLLIDADLPTGNGGYTLGAFVIVFATIGWAVGSIVSRHADQPESQVMGTGAKMLGGGVALIVGAAVGGEFARVDITGISWVSLSALLYLITFGSVAFGAYIWLLKASTPDKAATYAYVNPAVAVILGTWLADEPFTLKTAIATGIIIVAVLLIVTYRRRPAPMLAGQVAAAPAPGPRLITKTVDDGRAA